MLISVIFLLMLLVVLFTLLASIDWRVMLIFAFVVIFLRYCS